jgi:hypothetical protein
MIAIRSYIPSLLTFPGVVLRQAIHAGCCRALGVKVLDIRYFRADTPSGYVLHEMPKSLGAGILIAIGPLVLHSLLCIIICAPALVPFKYFEHSVDFFTFFQLWLGLSIDMHAFPPLRDAGNLWELTRREVLKHAAFVRLTFPLLAFLRTAQRLSLYGFDVAYAAVIGIGIPWVLLDRIFPVV